MSDSVRPPLGPLPDSIWKTRRVHELVDAMHRASLFAEQAGYDQSRMQLINIHEWAKQLVLLEAFKP